ncbi:MAG: lrga-associated rane protein LrgB [Clostridia bacterium]|jgi:predicted murein hydrolase (TIGR00659 family)|nr:lrga-associated rane protein LrgB [Clostridia bacterium]
MREITSTALFGVMISLIAFEIGLMIQRKTKKSFLNPLLLAIAIVIFVLQAGKIPLENYNKGGQWIAFLMAPATVALAVPLYKNFELLKKHKWPIIIGIFTGCVTSVASILLLSKAFGLDKALSMSLIPKSVTTPIGIEISKQLGGIPEVTVLAIVVTGITGAIIAPFVCKLFKINDRVAMGIAIGTSSHVLGTTKAIEMGEIEGGMSGLAIGVSGLVTVIIAPAMVTISQYLIHL